MILYNNKNRIIAEGTFTENSSHYIKDTTYFGKGSCNIADAILPELFDLDEKEYEYVDGIVQRTKKEVIRVYDFIEYLGMETILAILDSKETDKTIRAFDYVLNNSGDKIDTRKEFFLGGIGYLLSQSLITQEQHDYFIK